MRTQRVTYGKGKLQGTYITYAHQGPTFSYISKVAK